jgi:triacylglycerol lipase
MVTGGHRSLIGRRGALLALVGIAMVWSNPLPAKAASLPPVLLVHGFESSPAVFGTMAARLKRDGRAVYAIALPGQDNVVNAGAIRAFVVAHRLRKVDIVAHSMGGLSSRWFIRFLRGSIDVIHYVSLGTPQHGLWLACLAPPDDGGQMCPLGTFIGRLDAGDDEPGPTRYTSIFSTTDGIVPPSSAHLDGGACLVQDRGVGHFALPTDARVYRQVVAALGGRCPAPFS